MQVSEKEQRTEWGGGAEGKIHTIILHDMHREYTGDFDRRIPDLPYGQTEIFWSSSGVIDTLTEIWGYNAEHAEQVAARLLKDFAPPEFLEREGDYIEALWRITGSLEYLEIKFRELHDALRVDSVSGDDDAFDYWPNTMNMLWDFALDLDAISHSIAGTHQHMVWEVAQWVFVGTVGQDANDKGQLDEYRRQLFVGEWGLDREDDELSWRSWYLRTVGQAG